ncbi:MAG: hypothetical protein OQJ89_09015, partial [Kangiellaceae bacterium]|nr:hypothetical protein [Kangiellaceae bacterium]
EPSKCIEYTVAGEAWHWQARGINTPDWIARDFYGSIEGFRLVLDSSQRIAQSAATKVFVKELDKAQQKARKNHNLLQSIPSIPTFLSAELKQNNNVKLRWRAIQGKNIEYTVYRSYIDPDGKITREPQKVATALKSTRYSDQLPGNGAASYTIVAKSEAGESMPSQPVNVGNHKAFSIGEKIQAEQYQSQRRSWIRFNEKQHSVAVSASTGHYPTGKIPFQPGWLKFNFKSNHSGQAKLTINMRTQKGAKIEIWQGIHLVDRFTVDNSKDLSKIEREVSLIKGDAPLELRTATPGWIEVDWLEFNI